MKVCFLLFLWICRMQNPHQQQLISTRTRLFLHLLPASGFASLRVSSLEAHIALILFSRYTWTGEMRWNRSAECLLLFLRWRTKQNLDYCFLMMYAQSKGTYYVQVREPAAGKPPSWINQFSSSPSSVPVDPLLKHFVVSGKVFTPLTDFSFFVALSCLRSDER